MIKGLGRQVKSSMKFRVGCIFALLYFSLVHLTLPTSAYSLTYFDCSSIQHLQTYQLQDVCKHQPLSGARSTNATKRYQLLQKGSAKRVGGHSCRVVSTKFTDYCGAYGHIKHVRMPEIAVSRTISPQTCSQMISTQRFISDDGVSHPIELQTENIIHSQELGSVELGDNSVTCRGQPMNINGHVINDITVLSQYAVTVVKQEFLVRGNQVEVVDGHIILPENICGMEKMGCTTHDTTYIWTPPPNLCEYEVIRTIEVTEESGYLVDRTNKILLKSGGLVSTTSNCPSGMIQHTNFHNLFLASEGMAFPEVTNEADIATYINGRDDFVLFEAENLVMKQRNIIQGTVCKNRLEERGQKMIRVRGNQFIRANGDAVEHFTCSRRTGQIKGAPQHCYEEIPLQDGRFVKVVNRVATVHASPIPCNGRYGIKLQTLEGVWIEITDKLIPIATPRTVPVLSPDYSHEDLSRGGIYTEEELTSWNQHVQFGDLHEAIIKTITLGVCNGQGTCPASPEVPAYHLNNLLDPEHLLEDINPVEHVKTFIVDNAVWVSVAVLVWETLKMIVFLSSIVTTVLQEGLSGLLAVMYVIVCGSRLASERVMRKGKRRKLKENIPLYPIPEEVEMT